jgi:hypothetical protein
MSDLGQANMPGRGVIDAMWKQAEPQVFITREQFERDLEGWTIEPVERDGVLVGAFVTRGPELHFATFSVPGGKPVAFSLRLIREHLEPLIEQYGFVRTRTPKDATRQHRFNERMGFVAEGESEFFIHYRMNVPAWRPRCP